LSVERTIHRVAPSSIQLFIRLLLQVNMLALYNVGPAVEGTLGGNHFLGLYS
jgi:hypothetical protein